MFKKATIYCVNDAAQLAGLEEKLDQAKFLPCASEQIKSSGWAEVREGALFMQSHGHLLFNFMVEKKVIPGSALRRAVEETCKALEDEQGFPPGKKARAEIRERKMDELAARALTTRATTGVWVDTERGRIVIDSSVVGTLDLIISALVKTTKLDLTYLNSWAGKDMTHWLMDENGDVMPDDYTIDDAVQMEYPGERGTVVAFKKADLSAAKVGIHVVEGAQVTKMALTYKSRISFVLQPTHQLINLHLLDVAKENQVAQDADEQENNFMLMALELRALIDSLSEEA